MIKHTGFRIAVAGTLLLAMATVAKAGCCGTVRYASHPVYSYECIDCHQPSTPDLLPAGPELTGVYALPYLESSEHGAVYPDPMFLRAQRSVSRWHRIRPSIGVQSREAHRYPVVLQEARIQREK